MPGDDGLCQRLPVEQPGFVEQTDRRQLRNSADPHSPPYAAAGHPLHQHGAGISTGPPLSLTH